MRDTYDLGDKLVIVTTDRQSAFDRLLAAVPFKGQVLNQTSAWWMGQTQHIVKNALLAGAWVEAPPPPDISALLSPGSGVVAAECMQSRGVVPLTLDPPLLCFALLFWCSP